MERKATLWVVFVSIAFVLAIIVVLSIIIPIALVFWVAPLHQGNATTESFELHTNPNDPIIISGQTSEGETISILGNKSSTGIPQTIDEFRVEDDEGTVFVNMENDGSIGSVFDSDGIQMNMTWGANFTEVHVVLISSNGTEQVSININLTKTVENITDLDNAGNGNNLTRRSLNENFILKPKTRAKRQTSENSFADTRISVKSCDNTVNNAQVFATVLTNYDESTGSNSGSSIFIGVRTQIDGQYQVLIPTSKESNIGEKASEICDSIEMVLSDVCDFYDKINKITKIFTQHNADSVICFILGSIPQLKLFKIYRFCKKAFKGLIFYCDKIDDKDLSERICDGLKLVDNAIDLFEETKILFTPTAIFPEGNQITAQGQVITLSPGSNQINNNFVIEDNDRLKIIYLDINPFDPLPMMRYIVTATFECYTSSFRVTMSIVGTDNYKNTVSCSQGPTCILIVPGALALVEDTVTVIATDTGTVITRIATIIF